MLQRMSVIGCGFAIVLLALGSVAPAEAQPFFVTDVAVTEGDSGTSKAVFTVSVPEVVGIRCNPITLDFTTVNGTASAGVDYQPISGMVVLDPSTLATCSPNAVDVVVTVIGDQIDEGASQFFLLDVTDPLTAQVQTGTGTITDDDTALLSVGDATVVEGDSGTTNAVFTLSLTAAFEDDFGIGFRTADGSATSPEDYQEILDVAVINAGDLETTFSVTVNGDSSVEDDETFFVDLDVGRGLPPITDPQGMATILNDDGLGTLSINDVSIDEGDTGQSTVAFTVSLSETNPIDVFVDFATSNGTAKSGPDYRATSGRVAIPAGNLSTSIGVSVEGDTNLEADESFFVNLTGSSGPTIADNRGTATIVNDDGGGGSTVRLETVPSVGEAAGTARILLIRSGNSSQAASVRLTVTSGTASAGLDFEPVDVVVGWSAGETGSKSIDVSILDDDAVEGDETAAVVLSEPTGAILGTPATAELTIVDDESATGIELVGEDEPLAIVGQQTELAVRVLSASGDPVENAAVDWAVEGDAEIEGEAGDRTDSQGTSARTIRLGATPGIVVVTATLVDTGQVIRFTLTVEGDLQELFPEAGPETGEASVAAVLDSACVSATGQFGAFCSYLFTLPGPGDQRAVLGEITPEEIPAQGSMNLESSQTQLRNVGARLAALRSGGSRQAISQLALNINGRPVPWQAMAAAMAPVEQFTLPDFADEVPLPDAEPADDEPAASGDTADLDATSRFGFFVNGRISMGERDGSSAEEGFDVDSQGVTVGVDYRLSDRFVFGGALGLLDTDLDLVDDGGGLDADGVSLSAYASYFRPTFYLDWVVAYGTVDYELTRHVDLPIAFQSQNRWIARGNPDSDQISAAMSAGYDRQLGATAIGFFAKGSYIDATIDGYTETGAGPFNLSIGEQQITSLLAESGVEILRSWSHGWGVLQPSLRLAYLHEFDDDSRLIRGSFRDDSGGSEFVLATDTPDRDFFNLGTGLTFVLTHGRSFYAYYDTDLERSDLDVFTLSAGLRWEF